MVERGGFCTAVKGPGVIGERAALSLAVGVTQKLFESSSSTCSHVQGFVACEKSRDHGLDVVRCAVGGLEGTSGSVLVTDSVDSDSSGATARLAVDGRLGVGRNEGTVGDSGSSLRTVLTSEKLDWIAAGEEGSTC